MTKTALITGITGQDGSYLAELLLKKKYKVHGIVRRVALEDKTHRLWRLRRITNKIKLHAASLESYASLVKLIQNLKPDEVYHLGAQSYVDYSFKDEFSTLNTNINGTHYILSALKEFSPKSKFYFAGSSEMFGKVKQVPQSEKTPFHPRSVYGISKVAGYDLTRNYREAYNMFCCSGILFNHESPRRGFEFVTRKITHAVARIKFGLQKELRLGNMDAKRDWGHAKDYVEVMWKILQYDTADDWVIATGETFSVRHFLCSCFEKVGIGISFEGKGIDEIGIINKIPEKVKHLSLGDVVVVVDKKYFRPTEVELLVGDSSKARDKLSWEPKYNLKDLIEDMMNHDLKIVEKELFLKQNGFKTSKKVDDI